MLTVLQEKIDNGETIYVVVGSNEYEITNIQQLEYDRGFSNSSRVETYFEINTTANGTYIVSELDSHMFNQD